MDLHSDWCVDRYCNGECWKNEPAPPCGSDWGARTLASDVGRQREHDAFIAEYSVLENDCGVEVQYLVEIRKQIAESIRRGR